MKLLEGRLALVTGAGRGIGAAIARGMAEAGARVIVADIDPTAADQTAQTLKTDGLDARGERLDVTDREALTAFASYVANSHGDLSILVNNAGVAGNERIDDAASGEVWDRNIAVNLTGAFNMARAFLPALKTTRGSIVNISSVVAFASGFAHVGYTASKGGIRSLTQVMCREFAPFGIRVNAVAPGYIDTPMGGKGDGSTDEWLRWHCPWQRFGEPHEVASPVVFLASAGAGFINGVTLPVDGGYLTI
ncbi:SDR family oxidoreductase [Mesorhizobium sp. AR07]|uniref:SDR family NAD(P)-dependent oxidoreductase n=1 Tax=Mesorhizobium sp. AR07 TaxID=2865838 RepID=UPI00215F6037|nr:SDR family NAD(P)-dependent oxidoreductase [Mesorhizobium sp. AR07]UVK43877.1 SDR family oxidoreductase [Mesorhizobium sp. AR07]